MAGHNVGIIGYGGFGQFLCNSWQQMPNVNIVAVSDEIPSRNPGGNIRFHKNWHDLAEDDQVEIISIATPPLTHSQMACTCLQAGKHVLIEKPIATNIDDAGKILKAHSRTGCIATVDYMLRFNPVVEALGKLTREKTFGQLRHVNVENYAQDQGLPAEHWFWDEKISGGILIEHAVHFIDFVHSLTDQKYRAVTGFSHHRNQRQRDQVTALVLYDKGLIASHYHSFARPGFFENTSIRLNYDLAQIDIEGWIPMTGKICALVNSQTRDRLAKLPNLKITEAASARNLEDLSRPKGWGREKMQNMETPLSICAGGIKYEVDESVTAVFDIGKEKHQVYADCVRAMLNDLISKVENPEHQLKVTLEDGFSSLEIACLAAESAGKY